MLTLHNVVVSRDSEDGHSVFRQLNDIIISHYHATCYDGKNIEPNSPLEPADYRTDLSKNVKETNSQSYCLRSLTADLSRLFITSYYPRNLLARLKLIHMCSITLTPFIFIISSVCAHFLLHWSQLITTTAQEIEQTT